MSYTQIESILGQPVPHYVIKQLRTRSKKTLEKRDNQALVYAANKSGWVRVVSSVDISGSIAGVKTQSGASLAQQNVLFGGLSAYEKGNTYKQYPYFSSNPENARRDQFDSDYGFRPMPGITNAKISTQGKLGSLLIAEIDFRVNTKAQLDLVDILYFKIGYSMLVEWGNTFYYKHKTIRPDNNMEVEATLRKSEDDAIDPFTGNPSKEDLRIRIAKAIKNTEGNYGAMLGVVTNYNFTMNADGGYDCKIKIMSPGMLGESMRVNGIPALPKAYIEAIQNLTNVLNTISKTAAEKERERQRKEEADELVKDANSYPDCVRKLINSGDLPIGKTSGGLTGARAQVFSGPWAKYVFFYDETNPGSPTKGRYLEVSSQGSTKGTYACDQYGNIVDADSSNILGKVINQPLPDYETFVQNARSDAGRSSKNRYLTIVSNDYYIEGSNGQTAFTDYIIRDKPVKAAYYAFDKFKKIIDLDYDAHDEEGIPKRDKNGNALKININFSNLVTDYEPDWKNVLYSSYLIEDEYNELTFLKLEGDPFKSGFRVSDVDKDKSITLFAFSNTYWEIKYADRQRNFTSEKIIRIYIKNEFEKASGVDYFRDLGLSKSLGDKITYAKLSNDNINIVTTKLAQLLSTNSIWPVGQVYGPAGKGNSLSGPSNRVFSITFAFDIDNLPLTTFKKERRGGAPSETKTVNVKQRVSGIIYFEDLEIATAISYESSVIGEPPIPQIGQAQPNETQEAVEPPLDYNVIDASELQKSEQSMYTSQLEAMLRVIQITTIAKKMNPDGFIDDVKKINWTEGEYADVLYNGLFIQGAMKSGENSLIKTAVERTGSINDTDREAYINDNTVMGQLKRYEINLYYGFHRGLMKANDKSVFNDLDKEEYKVNFKELLTSYVIPYYQSKTLIEGGDIHYPTYVPLGFFFMMLNHCSFLYDTSISGVNIPMFYLDFNTGTNIMLSSDFMLTANPYKFVVPFTGDIESYKKLFDKELVQGDRIGSGSESSEIWKYDAISSYIPQFKYVDNGADPTTNVYRGKTMNVLVSIDYLLDVIKKHSQRDETNSVYFRPMMEELLSDLEKCLGSYNVFRLAYDDSSNCFYVVDDQLIPGNQVLSSIQDIETFNTELPLFGRDSVARSFTITTENSSKLGSMAFISANQDVKNQSTLGVDGTSIGALSLYAIDRYKRVTTAANDNATIPKPNPSSETQRKAVAASRFNEAINSFYFGGLRSENMVDQAVNYHIEAVARTRARGDDSSIRSTTLLPLSINFSTDGISSMAIYQSFTVNRELLPYSYKYGMNQSETRQVGFIITGLEHTIQNNTWTTDVRANMYYVKRTDEYIAKKGNQEQAPKFKDVPQALLADGSNLSGTISDTPWSAAFISYVMKQASVDFPVNAAHTGYAQSLRNNTRGFSVLNPKNTTVQIGDIIVQNRSGNNLTYSTDPWTGFSHGDIIVSLVGNSSTNNYTTAYAIGGNVNQTVFKSVFQLGNSILIKPGFFVILRPPSQYASTIVSIANREYDLWQRNNWTELSADAYSTIKQYYSTVSINV